MRTEEKIDPRDMRDGGWSWVQDELHFVFAPIIGPEAAWLYTVMCKLIPQTIENPLMELSIRTIERVSGYSTGTVHRKLAVLAKIGMIEQTRYGGTRPSTFTLVNLRKLATLGEAELRRRLTVPAGNSEQKGADADASAEPAPNPQQGPSLAVEAISARANVVLEPGIAPETSDAGTVPLGNSEPDSQESGKTTAETNFSESALFQKRGGTVPEKGGYCSTGERPLILNLSKSTNTPLPPSSARGVVFSKPDGHDFPAAEQRAVAAAVAKVMRECNLSERRLAVAIERQMRVQAAKTDQLPDWNGIAESMVAAYKRYAEYGAEGLLRVTVRARRFFAEGLWVNSGLWMIDEDRLRMRSNARIGLGGE